MTTLDLTQEEITGLRWMAKCNSSNIGFLGPSIRKAGPFREYDRLIQEGLAKAVHGYHRKPVRNGYWILPKGSAALNQAIGGIS